MDTQQRFWIEPTTATRSLALLLDEDGRVDFPCETHGTHIAQDPRDPCYCVLDKRLSALVAQTRERERPTGLRRLWAGLKECTMIGGLIVFALVLIVGTLALAAMGIR